jgi:hypothetical protein
MIVSNINEILTNAKLSKSLDISNQNAFINALIESNEDENIERNSDLTFDNIKGITLEEIQSVFVNQEDKDMAENLRLATLFTDDIYLQKALFNTVLGQPFYIGYSYLFDSYEDKNIFLNSKNDSLSDLLHKSLLTRIDDYDMKPTDKISQTRINEVLTAVNSFSFVDALSSTYKDQYDKYKEDNQYSFLYNDYNLKYQELKYKYDDLKDIDKGIIFQYR